MVGLGNGAAMVAGEPRRPVLPRIGGPGVLEMTDCYSTCTVKV